MGARLYDSRTTKISVSISRMNRIKLGYLAAAYNVSLSVIINSLLEGAVAPKGWQEVKAGIDGKLDSQGEYESLLVRYGRG